jgi:hypothetical protein
MQLTLDFTPGLTTLYPRLGDALHAQVYSCGQPLRALAAHMDMSQRDLSRKLFGEDGNGPNLSLTELEQLIEATGSRLVIHWLIERFLQDPQANRHRALAELQHQVPALLGLLKTLGQ